MRGAGDELSIGERIAFYRRRRGLSQKMLAGLVGRSEDWLSKIERGERQARRLDVLTALAKSLRVELGDLLGHPVYLDEGYDDADVPAVRDALMSPRRLSRTLFREESPRGTPDPAGHTRRVEIAWSRYQAGALGEVLRSLPELIRSAQDLEEAAHVDAVMRSGWASSARVHHLASTVLAKIGEADLSWIAAERAMRAADRSEDPLVLASAARAGVHALLATGRYPDALDLGDTAASWLRDRMRRDDPAALSMYGMLRLRSAVAAARHDDRDVASSLLADASRVAQQIGRDANYWQTSFGPTNVELHRLSIALGLGDVSYVIEHGPRINPEHLPVERVVMHGIELARAFSLAAQDDDATERLLTAERKAPALVRSSAVVRETVKDLYRRSPASAGAASSALLGLAQRCRAIA